MRRGYSLLTSTKLIRRPTAPFCFQKSAVQWQVRNFSIQDFIHSIPHFIDSVNHYIEPRAKTFGVTGGILTYTYAQFRHRTELTISSANNILVQLNKCYIDGAEDTFKTEQEVSHAKNNEKFPEFKDDRRRAFAKIVESQFRAVLSSDPRFVSKTFREGLVFNYIAFMNLIFSPKIATDKGLMKKAMGHYFIIHQLVNAYQWSLSDFVNTYGKKYLPVKGYHLFKLRIAQDYAIDEVQKQYEQSFLKKDFKPKKEDTKKLDPKQEEADAERVFWDLTYIFRRGKSLQEGSLPKKDPRRIFSWYVKTRILKHENALQMQKKYIKENVQEYFPHFPKNISESSGSNQSPEQQAATTSGPKPGSS